MNSPIATTKEQSRRLLDCGVLADTADMCYDSGALSLMDYDSAVHERDSRRESYEVIPAWSLSALLSIMPDLEHCFSLWKFEEDDTYAADATMVNPDFRVDANDPIEACVGLIEILHANGYKLNGIEKGGEE